MRKITLKQGGHALIDDEDYSMVSLFNWETIHRVKDRFILRK